MEEAASIHAKGMPPVLRRFCAWVAAMTLLSELFSWAMLHWFGERPAYGGSFDWSGAGTDFNIYREQFQAFHTARFWDAARYPFTYPAPLGLVYWLCYRVLHAWPVYLALTIVALLAWAWITTRRLKTFVLLIALLAVAWPVRMLLETGNIEAVVAVLLGLGVLAAMRGQWWLGAVLIGIAGSMKLYPLMLLGLPLSQRRYREFAGGIAAAVVSTLAGLWALGPSVLQAQQHINTNMLFLKSTYILSPVPAGLQSSHSLFNLVKLSVIAISRWLHPDMLRAHEAPLMSAALNVYVPVAAVFGLALYFVAIRRMPLLNQVIALTVCAVLLPPFSLDYTLVQLLVPIGLLLGFTMDAWSVGEEPRGLAICYACLALILTTGAYFEVKYRFAAQVRTLALMTLLVAVLRFPFVMRTDRRAYG